MTTQTIYNRFSQAVLFSCEAKTLREAVEKAVAEGVSLAGADLTGANLSGATLYRADLSGATLYRADLTGANLTRVNLSGANLTWANLTGANLTGANLTRVNLSGADLTRADLTRANLEGANLTRATGAELVIARTRILPDEGDIIGWKKCAGEKIVKLLISDGTKRSHAFGRKCRAQSAKVLEIFNNDGTISSFAVSAYNCQFTYRVGETVSVPNFSDNWQEECAPGIHFFITRTEAENY